MESLKAQKSSHSPPLNDFQDKLHRCRACIYVCIHNFQPRQHSNCSRRVSVHIRDQEEKKYMIDATDGDIPRRNDSTDIQGCTKHKQQKAPSAQQPFSSSSRVGRGLLASIAGKVRGNFLPPSPQHLNPSYPCLPRCNLHSRPPPPSLTSHIFPARAQSRTAAAAQQSRATACLPSCHLCRAPPPQ